MSIATLADIITKVRRLTGSANDLQLTDDMIKDYINSFYLYDFPAQFRSLKLKDLYTFVTTQGIDTYAFDSEKYTTVEMPAYCANAQIQLFNDPWSFYQTWYNWQQIENFATGANSVGPYVGTLSNTPLLRSVNNDSANINFPASRIQNILITANTSTGTINVTDDGNGILNEIDMNGEIIGLPVGLINYQTGSISIIFSQPIPNPNAIQAQYNPQTLGFPESILFFQNQFVVRPVPSQGFTIQLVAYRQPTQALENAVDNTGTPELLEWWETIAFGAAKKVYEDRLDMDGVAMMDKALKERYDLNYTRTYAQLGKQRVATIFAGQLSQNLGNGWGFGQGP